MFAFVMVQLITPMFTLPRCLLQYKTMILYIIKLHLTTHYELLTRSVFVQIERSYLLKRLNISMT